MKNMKLYCAVFSAIFATGLTYANPQVSGKITHESAQFLSSGNPRVSSTTHGEDTFKTETSARIYIDGELERLPNGGSYHVEIQGYHNGEAIDGHDDNEEYTQREFLREAYVDTTTSNWNVRLGKQQVVWGTADGAKLLDVINPTDYTEMAQNQMEDSRIPIWMLNAETQTSNGGNLQFVISESKSNVMAGLGDSSDSRGGNGTASAVVQPNYHTNSDTGHPFILKCVDTITGKRYGFLNMAPAMGLAAQVFDRGALYDSNSTNSDGPMGSAKEDYVSLQGYYKATVNEFATNSGVQAAGFRPFCDGSSTSADCLSKIINNQLAPNGANFGAYNQNKQELLNVSSLAEWNAGKASPTQMFHYMPEATFATFDNFVNMKSSYSVEHNKEPNIGTRYSNSLEDGTNYSINLLYGNDPNPYIEMEWLNGNGEHLYENLSTSDGYQTLHLSTTEGSTTNTVGGKAGSDTSASDYALAGTTTNVATLAMKEKLNKVLNIGGSFDRTIETDKFGPVVLRGEAVYQKGVMKPVIVRKDATGRDLNHGFLVSSVKMEEADMFKYVLGMDITALTNMMISAQFIQERNLDYVDIGSSAHSEDNWKYTADMASMHVTNNLLKGEENKEFVSLFLSKPFGESGQHRWNNITMFEDTGGRWNRFDVEYTINDNALGILELNKYWGDDNSQFGQLSKQSNVQVGMKYTF